MEKITIGRSPECTIRVDELYVQVSNEHADVIQENGSLIYIDHSTNGTTINGQKLYHDRQEIKQGDIIKLADTFQLEWHKVSKYFPSLHRATERFDGSQVETGTERKTERFDGSNIGNVDTAYGNDNRMTERVSGASHEVKGIANDFSQAEIEDLLEKWHWGAFLSSWVWALAQKVYWPLLIIPISLIPYLGQICSIFLCVYLGLNGHKIGWANQKDDFLAYRNSQGKWTGIGVVLFLLFAAISFASLYYVLELV